MQILLILSGILIFILFFLPVFWQVLNFGNLAGMAAGALFLVSGALWERISFSLQKYILFALLVFVCAGVILSARILWEGRSNAGGQRVLLVLGCRVKGDVPSLALEKRVDSAYFYLLSNPDSVAILSGGQGRDENLSEALCMKRMLTQRGISANRLLLEDRSTSTYENVRFSRKYIEELGVKEIAVATSEYHQKRAKRICARFGLKAYAVSSKTAPVLLPTFVLREIFALAKEYLLKK